MYAKIAIGNIKRSFGDYSIYFMTLAFAACLLYSFTASTDYLLALDLSEQQRGVYDSANGVLRHRVRVPHRLCEPLHPALSLP